VVMVDFAVCLFPEKGKATCGGRERWEKTGLRPRLEMRLKGGMLISFSWRFR
jgi:hypothetical protein